VFLLIRALTYSALFIGFLLVFLPRQILTDAGIARPPAVGVRQVVGLIATVSGGLLAASCILAFLVLGRGTPAPFDAPRKLVVRGPYRFVRNPMYLGSFIALVGAASYFESWQLAAYALLYLAALQAFVIGYEEPTLRRIFGTEYDAYSRHVGRWWPALLAHRRHRHGADR
jgi:protein-S-isoprenylcysteine O-methyltransferase Ste14